jgi:hypothetical protein
MRKVGRNSTSRINFDVKNELRDPDFIKVWCTPLNGVDWYQCYSRFWPFNFQPFSNFQKFLGPYFIFYGPPFYCKISSLTNGVDTIHFCQCHRHSSMIDCNNNALVVLLCRHKNGMGWALAVSQICSYTVDGKMSPVLQVIGLTNIVCSRFRSFVLLVPTSEISGSLSVFNFFYITANLNTAVTGHWLLCDQHIILSAYQETLKYIKLL